MARPRTDTPPYDGTPPLCAVNCAGPVLSHTDWLATLRRRDIVRIRNGAEMMQPAMVTNDTPCYVFVGKLKFWRRHGWQVARQSGWVFRTKLRLVRTELDPG